MATLQEDKTLLLNAINILDTITENNTGKNRTDTDFKDYETWATRDIKRELTSMLGEIEVEIQREADTE
ncbi:hypothetical protein PXD04_10295 [Methanosphaera sp. ISO3-F5]|uniref:hypothetical protein n=1 Tax=Methanosphaera sp. ISO3-F5 TaxID=1452353 RepID=UPI002B262993|nr:hypothetical protein [Methanosphaera sp. ISO3-F5]WQH64080.1 hypothetical protein PXD04_10295 [Methanosphaera sp. ISO3-F5]